MLKYETIHLSTFAGLHGLATVSTSPPPILYASRDNPRNIHGVTSANITSHARAKHTAGIDICQPCLENFLLVLVILFCFVFCFHFLHVLLILHDS